MIKWTALLLLFACIGCVSQVDKREKYSLLTWEYKREGEGVLPNLSKVLLVKYQWKDSAYERTELFQSEYKLPNYSLHGTSIYKDRYLINTMGDVLDLETNTFTHEHIGFDPFITREGDRLFFRHVPYKPNPSFHSDSLRHQAIKKAFYVFDLATKKIEELDKLPMADKAGPDYSDFPNNLLSLPAEFSPDKRKVAYFRSDNTILMDSSLFLCGWTRIYPSWGSLYIKSIEGDSVKIADSVLFETSIRMPNYLPLLWLNDKELVTQKTNGQLLKIDVTTGKTTSFSLIPGLINCNFTTRFEKTASGEIFYYCRSTQGDLFHVNTDSLTVQPATLLPLPGGYAYGVARGHPGNTYVKAYYYNDRPVTNDSTTTIYHSITPDGLIAIQCTEVIPSRGYDDPRNIIRIIDPVKKEEIKIKVDHLRQLIGWVKE